MNRRLELTGWLLWLVGVGFFAFSGIRNDDPWSTVGSILFGVGIVCLLIPLLRRRDG